VVSKGLLMVSLAVISGTSVSGCRGSAALPPSASISHAPAGTAPGGRFSAPQSFDQFTRPYRFNQPGIPVRSTNPWRPKVPPRDWKYIVLHHTATSRGSVESIHRTHRQRRDKNGNRWLGIGYHFVIGNGDGMPDGAIEPTFRWRQQLQGAHAGDSEYNDYGIGIAMVGNFNEGPPSSAQMAAVKRLVGVLKANYHITADRVVGHNEIKATACPGKYFPMAEVSWSLFGPATGQYRPAGSVRPWVLGSRKP